MEAGKNEKLTEADTGGACGKKQGQVWSREDEGVLWRSSPSLIKSGVLLAMYL